MRAGICAAHLQDMDAAVEHFHALLTVDPVDFADLYLDVGDLLAEQSRFDEVCILSSTSHAASTPFLHLHRDSICLP